MKNYVIYSIMVIVLIASVVLGQSAYSQEAMTVSSKTTNYGIEMTNAHAVIASMTTTQDLWRAKGVIVKKCRATIEFYATEAAYMAGKRPLSIETVDLPMAASLLGQAYTEIKKLDEFSGATLISPK